MLDASFDLGDSLFVFLRYQKTDTVLRLCTFLGCAFRYMVCTGLHFCIERVSLFHMTTDDERQGWLRLYAGLAMAGLLANNEYQESFVIRESFRIAKEMIDREEFNEQP